MYVCMCLFFFCCFFLCVCVCVHVYVCDFTFNFKFVCLVNNFTVDCDQCTVVRIIVSVLFCSDKD